MSHRKISVAVTFPIWPPRGGGQSRIFHLYRHLAETRPVEIICVTNANDLPSDREIAPGLREVRIPKSRAHRKAELELSRDVPGVPLADVVMPRLIHLTPDYGRALRASVADAGIAIASHPYLFPLLSELMDGPIWYEAHNVEMTLKRMMLPDTTTARELLAETERVERACCDGSERVIVCSADDGLAFRQNFGVPEARITEIPNGVDLDTVEYVGPEARQAAKGRLGLDGTAIVVFLGSRHKPNCDALDAILRFAPECPDMRFLILGSVCKHSDGRPVPPNVGLMGEVDDGVKATTLGVADGALNPMMGGSGTNLKMLDYLAAGVPVISTRQGARGLAVADGVHLQLSEIDGFPDALRRLQAEIGGPVLAKRVAASRRLVEKCYDWAALADRFGESIDRAGSRT